MVQATVNAVAALGAGIGHQAAAFAVDHQVRSVADGQDTVTSPDHGWEPQRPSQDGAVGCGATTGRDQAANALGVQPCHIGRAQVVRHQYIGFVRRCRHGHPAEVGQHAPANIPQICRPFGQKPVCQCFLGTRGGINGEPPAGFGRRAFVDGFQGGLVEIVILEHFHMHRQNRCCLTAFGLANQRAQLSVGFVDGPAQSAGLFTGIAGGGGVVQCWLAHDEGGCQSQAR